VALLWLRRGWAAKRKIPQVVFSTDALQFQGLAAALASLRMHKANPTQPVAVTIVTSRKDLRRAKQVAKCVGGLSSKARVLAWEKTNATRLPFLTPSDFHNTKGLNAKGNLSSALNYVRFYLGEFITGNDPVLYLDADVVTKCDVAKFLGDECPREFAEHSNATILVASRQYKDHGGGGGGEGTNNNNNNNQNQNQNPNGRSLKVQDLNHLFNAGVFVANMKRWRRTGATSRLEGLMVDLADTLKRNRSAVRWTHPSSQAPMTHVFADELAFLRDPTWNSVLRVNHEHPPPRRCCLWHYTGGAKPWHLIEDFIHGTLNLTARRATPDIALDTRLENDTMIRGLPWWATTWLPYARPCCVDPHSAFCKWHKALPASDLRLLNDRPPWNPNKPWNASKSHGNDEEPDDLDNADLHLRDTNLDEDSDSSLRRSRRL